MKIKASFFSDLFLTFFNLVDFKKPAQNIGIGVIEKFVSFLSSTKEFQALNVDQKQTVITRNVGLAASLIGITVNWIETGQEQLIFFHKLLTSFSGTDIFLNYIKPVKLTVKQLHKMDSKEQELQIEQLILNLQKLDSLTISDLEIFTIAILFHTEPNDTMPSMECYRNFLLKSLQSKSELNFDASLCRSKTIGINPKRFISYYVCWNNC